MNTIDFSWKICKLINKELDLVKHLLCFFYKFYKRISFIYTYFVLFIRLKFV